MRNFDGKSDHLIHNQIQDLTRQQNKMRAEDQRARKHDYNSRNRITSARGGIRTEGTLETMRTMNSARGGYSNQKQAQD
jgi:hypothetical protein